MASREAAPMSRTGGVRKLLSAATKFISGSDELPDLVRHARHIAGGCPTWAVSCVLTAKAPFGVVSTKPVFHVTAYSEEDAVQVAAGMIHDTYPGYRITSVTAAKQA